MTKLMGKKIGDSHTETSFAKKDLPKETRVMGEGDMATMDHKPDRYVRTLKADVLGQYSHRGTYVTVKSDFFGTDEDQDECTYRQGRHREEGDAWLEQGSHVTVAGGSTNP